MSCRLRFSPLGFASPAMDGLDAFMLLSPVNARRRRLRVKTSRIAQGCQACFKHLFENAQADAGETRIGLALTNNKNEGTTPRWREKSTVASCRQPRSCSNSSKVATLPTHFITSASVEHWRRSPKNLSRSSRMNWTITLYSSLSRRALIDSWTVGLGRFITCVSRLV